MTVDNFLVCCMMKHFPKQYMYHVTRTPEVISLIRLYTTCLQTRKNKNKRICQEKRKQFIYTVAQKIFRFTYKVKNNYNKIILECI